MCIVGLSWALQLFLWIIVHPVKLKTLFFLLYYSLSEVQFCPLCKSATCTAYLGFKSAKVCHVGCRKIGISFLNYSKKFNVPFLIGVWGRCIRKKKKVLKKLDNKQIGRNLLHAQHCPLKATSKTPSEPEKLSTAAGSRTSRNNAEKRECSAAEHTWILNVPVRGLGCQWAPCVQRASEPERGHTRPPSQSSITATQHSCTHLPIRSSPGLSQLPA